MSLNRDLQSSNAEQAAIDATLKAAAAALPADYVITSPSVSTAVSAESGVGAVRAAVAALPTDPVARPSSAGTPSIGSSTHVTAVSSATSFSETDNSHALHPPAAESNEGYRPVPVTPPILAAAALSLSPSAALDPLDELLANIDSPNRTQARILLQPRPSPQPKQAPTIEIELGPINRAASKQQIEPISRAPVIPIVPRGRINDAPPARFKGNQTSEDLMTKAADLKNLAKNLSIGSGVLLVIAELTRVLVNNLLGARANDKSLRNRIYDYVLMGILVLGAFAVYGLLVASARAKAASKVTTLKGERERLFGKGRVVDQPDEQRAGGKSHAAVQPDEQRAGSHLPHQRA